MNRWNANARACSLAGTAVLVLACGNVEEPVDAEPGVALPPIARETCADNPLLAGCAPDDSVPGGAEPTASRGRQREPRPTGGAATSELALARAAAENVLRANCGQCHGPELSAATARAGMNYIDDIDALVRNGKLTPLASADSVILRRMRDGSMPPLGSSGPRPSTRDVDTVAEFLDDPVFWPEHRPAASCEGQLISFDELYANLQQDLRSQDSEDRPFTRYVTLTNRYNAGVCVDDLASERAAVSKLVNMLSTRARLVAPLAIDRQRLVYRVDLRDYGWNRPVDVDGRPFRDAWEAIIAASPYAIPFVGNQADDLREDTLTDVPSLSADALLDVAALGNLYYALIGVDASQPLSAFVSEQLGIDIEANFEQGDVIRAGTSRSQISRQDRVLERHEIGVRRGSFWQSFDFQANDVGESIFANPFDFNQGGSEAIFTLRNGMLGFIIADRDDNIVAESDILLDTFQDDFVARTSVSCSNCHAQGFNVVADEVGPYVRSNRFRFQRDDLQSVAEIYPSPADFARIVEDDSFAFQQALSRIDVPTTGRDPVAATFVRFNLDMDLAAVAGELGLTAAELRRDINLLDPALGVLKALTIERDDFSALYERSLCILQRVSANQPDPARCDELLDPEG
jgi:mono/diheme cytochrome c family protein